MTWASINDQRAYGEWALCEHPNYVRLADLELAAAPVLAPMAVAAQAAVAGPEVQLLAFWAVKTVLLVQFALRQMYGAGQETHRT